MREELIRHSSPDVSVNEKLKLEDYYFYVLGTAGLLSWNTLLSAVDFFDSKYPNRNVAFFFPIPYFVSCITLNTFIVQISQRISLNKRLMGGLATMNAIVFLMFLNANIFAGGFGYFLLLFMILMLGVANILVEASCLGFAAMFPAQEMRKMQTGVATSGLIVISIRILCLIVVGDESTDSVSLGCYFVLITGVTSYCIIQHKKFTKTEFYRVHMKGIEQPPNEYELAERLSSDSPSSSKPDSPKKEFPGINSNRLPVSETVVKKAPFNEVFRSIMKYPFLLGLIYLQTLSMFPGVTLKKHLTFANSAWNVAILIFIYNLFDVVGRHFGGVKETWGKKYPEFVVLGRSLFFFTFLKIASADTNSIFNNDFLAVLNLTVFAFLNGYCTASLISSAVELVSEQKRETAAFIMQLSLYIGIAAGTFSALPFRNVGN